MAIDCWSLATAFFLQRGNCLVVHVPHLQYAKDNTAGEAGADEGAKNAGSLLLVSGFGEALAPQELAGEMLLVDAVVGGGNHLVDDLPVDAFGLEILDNAQAAELFVLFAKAGIAFCVPRVV